MALIFIIIGIVFFILRIRYVIQNAQLLASGFLVYMVYYELFSDRMRLGWELVEACYRVVTLGHLIPIPWWLLHFLSYLALLLAAGLPVLLVHLLLRFPIGKATKAAAPSRYCSACLWW